MAAGLRQRRRPAGPARTALIASRKSLDPARIAHPQAAVFRHCKAWWKRTRSIRCAATRAPLDRWRSGYRPETANSLFKLLLMAFGGVATELLDSSWHRFERFGSCRATFPRACLTAASTQPRVRFVN